MSYNVTSWLRYISTPCKNPNKLAYNLWIFNICNPADIFLGESTFGGTLTGSTVDNGSHFLYPDISHQNMSDLKNSSLLDSVVLSMGLDGSLSRPHPRKHREENRSSSGEDLAICMRTANSDDFIDKEPFASFSLAPYWPALASNGLMFATTGRRRSMMLRRRRLDMILL